MKAKAYVRVARTERGKPSIAISTKANDAALTDTRGNALPTVAFAVEFDISDIAFAQAATVIARVKVQHPEIVATVKQVKE